MKIAAMMLIVGIFGYGVIGQDVHAEDNAGKPVTNDTIQAGVVADFLYQQSISQRAIDIASAPIRSRSDLIAYISLTPKQFSPLERLSPDARQRFLDSLTFNENGLTGFHYADLQSELTPVEIYKVLSLFGAQSVTSMLRPNQIETKEDRAIMAAPNLMMEDHSEYYCSGRATCSHRVGGYLHEWVLKGKGLMRPRLVYLAMGPQFLD